MARKGCCKRNSQTTVNDDTVDSIDCNEKKECCPEKEIVVEEVNKDEEIVECSDPEIEAWLNEGDKNEKEADFDMKPLVDHIDDKYCDETRSMAVIENQSEVAYHDDGDMCIISDSMIAKLMKNMGKKKKSDLLDTIDEMDEEEEIKPKKLNRNSRSQKKAREERKLEAQKAKEEREQKEREQLKELAQKPVSKYTFQRPTKKTSSSLMNLALKQKKAKSQYLVC